MSYLYIEVKSVDWNIQKLDVKECDISWTSLYNICPLHFLNLRILNLNQNIIGSRGIKWFSKMNMPNIESLHLSYCYFQDQGAKHLTKALLKNISHIEICKWSPNSEGNKIGYDGYLNLFLANWSCLSSALMGTPKRYFWFGTFDQSNRMEAIQIFCLVTSKSTNFVLQNMLVSKIQAIVRKVSHCLEGRFKLG